jgi:hypothetical protein
VGECGRKWPESGLAVQMPCNPVTLCRNLRTLSFSILFLSLCYTFRIASSYLVLYAYIAVVGLSSGFSFRNWIALRSLSFSEISHRSVFVGRLLRRAIAVELDKFCGLVVYKLIDFCYGSYIQIPNLRVLARAISLSRANSLSPTKGKGPF